MIKNQNLLDQFFLNDEEIVKQIVLSAEINQNDKVLEIGAGTGIVTREIAKYAGEVFAVEIDRRFENDLRNIKGNLHLIFDNILEVLKNKKKYPLKIDKIIGSLPSSVVEPLMHILKEVKFDLAVFLIPLKFVDKLKNDFIFSDYFEIELRQKVFKKSFIPVPKTNWALIKMKRKPDPVLVNDEERFLRQYVYQHPKAKKKNALMEGLVEYHRLRGELLTKNQARHILCTKNPPFSKNFILEREGL